MPPPHGCTFRVNAAPIVRQIGGYHSPGIRLRYVDCSFTQLGLGPIPLQVITACYADVAVMFIPYCVVAHVATSFSLATLYRLSTFANINTSTCPYFSGMYVGLASFGLLVCHLSGAPLPDFDLSISSCVTTLIYAAPPTLITAILSQVRAY